MFIKQHSYISFNIYVSFQFYKAICSPYFLFQANNCHNTRMNTHAVILSEGHGKAVYTLGSITHTLA